MASSVDILRSDSEGSSPATWEREAEERQQHINGRVAEILVGERTRIRNFFSERLVSFNPNNVFIVLSALGAPDDSKTTVITSIMAEQNITCQQVPQTPRMLRSKGVAELVNGAEALSLLGEATRVGFFHFSGDRNERFLLIPRSPDAVDTISFFLFNLR